MSDSHQFLESIVLYENESDFRLNIDFFQFNTLSTSNLRISADKFLRKLSELNVFQTGKPTMPDSLNLHLIKSEYKKCYSINGESLEISFTVPLVNSPSSFSTC